MNWGHKLIIVFLAFGGLMGYMAYRSIHVNTDLVENDYYKKELKYQDVIDATNSANSLSSKIAVSQQKDAISIQLPQEMKTGNTTGNIWFYCAYNAKNDCHIPLQINADASQRIDKKLLSPGHYIIKFDWTNNQKHFYSEQSFTVL